MRDEGGRREREGKKEIDKTEGGIEKPHITA